MLEVATSVMRENDIRPDHLMAGQAERFAADIRRLLERRAEFVEVPCPACGDDRSRVAFQKYGLDYHLCRNCETLYVSPRPSPAVLEWYYSTSENYRYWNQYIFPASEENRRARIFQPRARRLAEICAGNGIRTGTFLEVGAGFGTFCEEVQKLGLFQRILAVEPVPELAETCRQKNLEVLQKPIEHVNLEAANIDVVASFEVVEHLFAPLEFLVACRQRLRPGGILVLTCPNVQGFDLLVLGPLASAVDVEHLNYFHPQSLALLLSRAGFEPLEVSTPGQLDTELVRKKALSGELDLSTQPFLHQILIKEWDRVGRVFQQFLAEHLLSSHLWFVARTPSETVLAASGQKVRSSLPESEEGRSS